MQKQKLQNSFRWHVAEDAEGIPGNMFSLECIHRLYVLRLLGGVPRPAQAEVAYSDAKADKALHVCRKC